MNLNKISNLVYCGSFLLLIPGFFLYHILVFHGMGPIFGGYFAYASFAVSVLLVTIYISVFIKNKNKTYLEILFLFILIFTVLKLVYESSNNSDSDLIFQYSGVVVIWLGLFFLGRLMPENNVSFNKVAFYSQVVILLAIIPNLESGIFKVGYYSEYVTYQELSVIYLFVVISCLNFLYNKKNTWVQIIVSLIAIVVIGGRSELLGLVVLYAIYLNSGRSKYVNILLQVFLVMLVYVNLSVLADFSFSRFTNLFNLDVDQSANIRVIFSSAAIDTIVNNPLAGKFGSYRSGEYAHNLLSIWVDFGLLGFVVYILLLVEMIRKSFSIYKNIRVRRFTISLSVTCLILLITLKNGQYFLIPFSVGYILSKYDMDRKEKISNKLYRNG